MLGSVAMVLMWAQAAASPGPAGPPASSVATADYGPARPPEPAPKARDPGSKCESAVPTEPGEIVVCAVRPDGYRIDPDVMEARRLARNRTKPKRPDRMPDTSCQTVGPMGCVTGPTVDFIHAAAVLGQMAAKLSKGESVGAMFVTQPEMTEYEIYQELKRKREEAEEAAAAKAAGAGPGSPAEAPGR